MKLYEYQAKELLTKFQIPLLPGKMACTLEQVRQSIQNLKGPWVVKAQVKAGGRGKAGGIVQARSLEELETAAQILLHTNLITPQTPSHGEKVKGVYIEQHCTIEQEIYLSLTLDRGKEKVCLLISRAGGINIEEVAHQRPHEFIRIFIDPYLGLQPFQVDALIRQLQIPLPLHAPFSHFLMQLYQAYWALDASLIEINPLVISADSQLYALDAKVTIDDNALYRQEKIRDFAKEEDLSLPQQKANDHGLSYIRLGGTIGCMVNGAGLAMATLDLLQFYGGEPANFLDIGGSATQERVKAAFELILSDPHVKVIFINIFGGIVRGEVLAEGILAALKTIESTALTLPVVARVQGTNHHAALELLSSSGLQITAYEDLATAAQQAVKISKQATSIDTNRDLK